MEEKKFNLKFDKKWDEPTIISKIENSVPIVYGTAGEIPEVFSLKLEEKYDTGASVIEKLKEYQRLYAEIWVKIEALLEKHKDEIAELTELPIKDENKHKYNQELKENKNENN